VTTPSLEFRDNVLTLVSGDTRLSETRFWNRFLRESDIGHVLPRTGVFTLANEECLNRLTEDTNANFCWFVTLDLYNREKFGDFKKTSHHFVFGDSRIIHP
jgi:hypothetical protein